MAPPPPPPPRAEEAAAALPPGVAQRSATTETFDPARLGSLYKD
eukprot:SAG22_NODE_94_length_20824_cov_230.693718_1_plen_43_part_10